MPELFGGVRVEGLRELTRNLTKLGIDVADLKGVFGRLAQQGAELAAEYAPSRSGALAASIRGSKARNYAAISAGNARRVPYAGAINYGWRRRNIAPSHFMQRASDALAAHVVPDLQAEVERLIAERGLA